MMDTFEGDVLGGGVCTLCIVQLHTRTQISMIKQYYNLMYSKQICLLVAHGQSVGITILLPGLVCIRYKAGRRTTKCLDYL